ncbi:MAG: hypothetical protein PGN16_13925 [Sphingomonas phyllosphaerae]|uniref:hypothetical protein n=1 Tax=Sphingomonas phyllosphaerae TaxID=257003 RepID=UPI002FFCB3A0
MLIKRIDSSKLEPFRVQRWTGKRLTASFGWSYDFESGRAIETGRFDNQLLQYQNFGPRYDAGVRFSF